MTTGPREEIYAPAPVGEGRYDDWSQWRGGRVPNQQEIKKAFQQYEANIIAQISILEDIEAAKNNCDKEAWQKLIRKFNDVGNTYEEKEALTPITGMKPFKGKDGKYNGSSRVGPIHPELERRGKEIRKKFEKRAREALIIWPEDCDKKQKTSVKILDVKTISGNNPYDQRNPIAEDSSQSNESSVQSGPSSPSGPSTPVATVQVINNIPISRLTLAGPDACPANHYHGNANNCNGVFTADPAPGVCGHGTVAAVVSIPVTSCPDL